MRRNCAAGCYANADDDCDCDGDCDCLLICHNNNCKNNNTVRRRTTIRGGQHKSKGRTICLGFRQWRKTGEEGPGKGVRESGGSRPSGSRLFLHNALCVPRSSHSSAIVCAPPQTTFAAPPHPLGLAAAPALVCLVLGNCQLAAGSRQSSYPK